MPRARELAVSLAAGLLVAGAARPAPRDVPIGAATPPQSTCPATLPAAVTDAQAQLDKDADALAPRLQLADALVDQGCYRDAVSVLEAGEAAHPHSVELQGKLRNVRSMVDEQTYIQDLSAAQEGALMQRNVLRCTKLSDLTACDEALKVRPDDVQLVLSKGDALMQDNRPIEAVSVYRRARELSGNTEIIGKKLTGAEQAASALRQTLTAEREEKAALKRQKPEAGRVTTPRSTPTTAQVAAAKSPAQRPPPAVPPSAPPAPALADAVPAPAVAYSNAAPAGRSN